ncbi:precorrin-4 C(11)-methyltransferase [Desulfurispora thermophila]|uniref:precorrin-4 C(11)-methyltransferase n=1 Tax=Desulfurispora thermophila TaxID=265470 RepID=UPI00036278D0
MNMPVVYFVGAGPGDPELITVKGADLLRRADVVVYAGSLVNPALLDLCRPGAVIYDSAGMHLQEMVRVMAEAAGEGKVVVRLHTGDPSLYGAIQEQMDALADQGVECRVVPGVSSFFAAAASLKQELTLPEVTQTVILTRLAGRTSVPQHEEMRQLARHQATMCIFLSVHMIRELVAELLAGGYPADTPVAVVYRASWPDERIVRGTLADIADRVTEAGIKKTALIIVSRVLAGNYTPSRLYDAGFAHGYRS